MIFKEDILIFAYRFIQTHTFHFVSSMRQLHDLFLSELGILLSNELVQVVLYASRQSEFFPLNVFYWDQNK